MKFDYEKSLTREQALEEYRARWTPNARTETVPLDQACGRVCAREMRALHALPVKRSSRCDGVAVRSADFADGLPDTSAWLRGRDFAQADTGDDFPDEFDAVLSREQIELDERDRLTVVDASARVEPGTGVNERGSTVREGSLIVPARTRLTPECTAALAIGGHVQAEVFAKPVVAFVPTGSELVPWGSFPERGQNIEANSLLVKGMVEQWGAQAVCYPIVRDDPATLDQALDRALACADIVVVNGGSSRGEEDYNSTMLQRRGSYFRHGVRAVPGRPVGMAIIDGTPVVNMPGPPLAAFLTLEWLVRGLISQYYGTRTPQRPRVRARMADDVRKRPQFERFVRVTLSRADDGGLVCTPVPGSVGTPASLAQSDGMVTIPAGVDGVAAGEVVDVELLRSLELTGAAGI